MMTATSKWVPIDGPSLVLPPENYIFDRDNLTLAIRDGSDEFELHLESLAHTNSKFNFTRKDGSECQPRTDFLRDNWRLRDAVEAAAWEVFWNRRYFRSLLFGMRGVGSAVIPQDFEYYETLKTGAVFDWRLGSIQRSEQRPLVRRPIPLFDVQDEGDAANLIESRYLCRGGSLLLSGPTGIGKSSLALQLAVSWGLGRECLGFEPSAPLSSLIVQAENDPGDVSEMAAGVADGMGLDEGERNIVNQMVSIHSAGEDTGQRFFSSLESLIRDWQPDLLIIDPLLAFVGDDLSKQNVAANFLRHNLAPLLRKTNMGVLILQHEGKPTKEGNQQSNLDYSGFGSSDLANWARAILSLRRDGDAFCLSLGKRGKRSGIVDDQGEHRVWLRHATGGRICWEQVEGGSVVSGNRAKTALDLFALVPESPARIPKTVLFEKAKAAGVADKKCRALFDELIANQQVHIHAEKRPGTNPLKYVARHHPLEQPETDSKNEPF